MEKSNSEKTPSRKKLLFLIVGFIVVLMIAGAAYLLMRQKTGGTNMSPVSGCNGTVALQDFRLESALDEQTQHKGLGGRDSLPQKCGMLFVFNTNEPHGIWMKDMKFNLDIMWLDQNKRIISIRENAPYNSYPEVYSPQADSKYVIELNAGQSRAGAFRVGQVLSFDELEPAKSKSVR